MGTMKMSGWIVLAMMVGACTAQKQGKGRSKGDDRSQKVEYVNDNTYLLKEKAEDKSYGFNKDNPIKVGGMKESSGPKNERRFLNALRGPNGEKVSYARGGSCCPFETPNGLLDNTGLLDRYWITWEGSKDTLNLYLNMYDYGNLKIPAGFTGNGE